MERSRPIAVDCRWTKRRISALGAAALLLIITAFNFLAADPARADVVDAGAMSSFSLLPAVPAAWAPAEHLVVVCGHAVLRTGHSGSSVQDEASWYLDPFQKGQLPTMLDHIRKGIELAARDNNSLLIFSGGETRGLAGPRSEASSYWEAAELLGWFGFPAVRERAVLEAYARDSLENLLFSLCRHREASGRYPSHVTVVSFDFKRHRFTELHRAALRWPKAHFEFVGIDPPGSRTALLGGEAQHSTNPFKGDPYGCSDAQLRAKRVARNPFRRSMASNGCPEMRPLLLHCKASLFDGALPW
jgi:hypothetical protein